MRKLIIGLKAIRPNALTAQLHLAKGDEDNIVAQATSTITAIIRTY